MASSFSLGGHFESFVQSQLASGRYNNASEVLRDALRLMEARDLKLEALRATLNASISAGGAHEDADITQALDEEEVALAQDGY
ncbi:MAG: type II toxin-antitoxin system ParD family antitoxin [Caulobacteraceae bacterium]|nr:type II toxin-antitoxin system ParD family antitoxin [Caulobacteraceae bacterium]